MKLLIVFTCLLVVASTYDFPQWPVEYEKREPYSRTRDPESNYRWKVRENRRRIRPIREYMDYPDYTFPEYQLGQESEPYPVGTPFPEYKPLPKSKPFLSRIRPIFPTTSASEKECTKIETEAKQFGINDIGDWVINNCDKISQHAPEFTCKEAYTFVLSCYKYIII